MAEHKNIHEAMAAVFSEMPTVKKDATATVRSQKGGYDYDYHKIETIVDKVREILSRHGLYAIQPTDVVDGVQMLRTKVLNAAGECIDMGLCRVEDLNTRNAQDWGKAVSYARRYMLVNAFMIVDGPDDDGAGATKRADSSDFKAAAERVTGLSGDDLGCFLRNACMRLGVSSKSSPDQWAWAVSEIEAHAHDWRDWVSAATANGDGGHA